jgi:cytochrome c
MSKSLKLLIATAAVAALVTPALAGSFNLGREATKDEVAAWDIDVRPDGAGLPEGKGTVAQGEEVFAEQCASCHGDFGEGVGRWPVLAGGQDTLKSDRPVKTIGSYWPYLSTVFDYVNRAMPFGHAQSLEPDQVYAITAYLLHMNDIVDAEFELSKENFTSVRLPNEVNFIDDPRPDTPVLASGKEPCMENCKEGEVKIINRAAILDVTPDEQAEAGKGAVD